MQIAVMPFGIRKRIFDLGVTFLSSPIWVPALLLCAAAIALLGGRPVFYVSLRRTASDRLHGVIKFRTMVRDADRIANRETVPIAETRFLNIPPNSSLYTRVGRFVERCNLTELPQLLHVIVGEMSIIGNRPLPANVIASLEEIHPFAGDRFITKAGLTGPVQLVGRQFISDEDRLSLEADYCVTCRTAYAMRLDLAILFWTVVIALGLRRTFSVQEVRSLMLQMCGGRRVAAKAWRPDGRRAFIRYSINLPVAIEVEASDRNFVGRLHNLSYAGLELESSSALAEREIVSVTVSGVPKMTLRGQVIWSRSDSRRNWIVGVALVKKYAIGEKLALLHRVSLAGGAA
jgi:lipopolysaccharide/colanic/teichoic acid biosynthesis glycosyltransferase